MQFEFVGIRGVALDLQIAKITMKTNGKSKVTQKT